MENRSFRVFAVFLAAFILIQFSAYFNILPDGLRDKHEEVVHQPINYSIFIDIEDYMLYLLKNGEYFKSYPISVGKSKTPSPIGYWKIVSKSDWGEGFGGRWMGLNVTWANCQ